MPVINFLFNNFIPILIFGFVFYIFLRIYKFRKRIGGKQTGDKDHSGITFSFTGSENPAAGIKGEGSLLTNTGSNDEKIFEGTTGGISWKLKSTIILSGSGASAAGRVWHLKSAWKTTDVIWPAGSFMVTMSTYGDIKSGEIKNTGFFNKILTFVADEMLDIYVAGYFGPEYRDLVGIKDSGVIIKRDQLKDFFILTNRPEIAEKFLDNATVNAISSWKKQDHGFQQEGKVDQFGVLFAPDAMIVSCQAALRNPEEIKIFTDFASAMAIKMKMQL